MADSIKGTCIIPAVLLVLCTVTLNTEQLLKRSGWVHRCLMVKPHTTLVARGAIF